MNEKLGCLLHLFVTVFLFTIAGVMSLPAITDVTMHALCPGKDECSLAISLSGFQQAVIGVGSLMMMPLVGNLSDKYGRKALLTLPMTLAILPQVILAYSRSRNFFYAYFVTKTITSMLAEGGVACLSLAYVADNISEAERASAFGLLSGIMCISFVAGTIIARMLSPHRTFQVAAAASMISLVYMTVFLKDTHRFTNTTAAALTLPLLNNRRDSDPNIKKPFQNIPSPSRLIAFFRSSTAFSQAATIAFFSSLTEGGLQASLMYFLRARFHFRKDQFADIMLIIGVAGTISQLFLMPFLAPAIGEHKLLSLGLLVACINIALNSIAWASWVPYVVAGFYVFIVFTAPCIRSIASKLVGQSEQGKAQGCLSGISSFANIISPLVFSPLTALFLSERAPFDFPGFSIMCIGLGSLIAFIQSMFMKVPPKASNDCAVSY